MSKLNKLVKMGGRVFAGALLCGSMMFGTVSAEEAPAFSIRICCSSHRRSAPISTSSARRWRTSSASPEKSA